MEHIFHLEKFGENWFSYPSIYSEMVKLFPSGSHFVEVGVWKAKSTAYMAVEIANSQKQIRFDAVDLFVDCINHTDIDLYEICVNNLAEVGDYVNLIKSYSDKSAQAYADKSLDFVFIDAGHDYDSVKKDILAYLPKMKNHSVIAGHDYAHAHDYTQPCPVRDAVRDIFGEGNFSDPWGTFCFMIYIDQMGNHSRYIKAA